MNIFARELAIFLAKKGKDLGSLYTLHTETYKIYPHKVTRLKRSLTGNITATLNADDLAMLAEVLKIDPNGQEMKRLRAALLAETVRHLLGGRMEIDAANQLGAVTFQLLQGKDPDEFLIQREDLLTNMRGGEDEVEEEMEPALEPTVEIYEQGALWLEVARDTLDSDARQSYLALAQSLLNRAKDLASPASPGTGGSTQQQEWLSLIQAALREATAMH